MNECSSLVFPAHLLVKQRPGQPHTPFAFSVSSPKPLPLLDLPTPSLQPGHLLLLHGWGGGKPVTLLCQAPLCSLATVTATL